MALCLIIFPVFCCSACQCPIAHVVPPDFEIYRQLQQDNVCEVEGGFIDLPPTTPKSKPGQYYIKASCGNLKIQLFWIYLQSIQHKVCNLNQFRHPIERLCFQGTCTEVTTSTPRRMRWSYDIYIHRECGALGFFCQDVFSLYIICYSLCKLASLFLLA